MFDNTFLNVGEKFPPESEKERLDLYEINKRLWNGEHDVVFAQRRYTLIQENKASIEFNFNWNKRLSVLFADLLLGEPPHIKVGDEGSKEQDFLNSILEATEFLDVAYKVAIDMHRYGSGIFKTYIEDSILNIQCLPPDIWFPVVDRSNINKVLEHVICIPDIKEETQTSYNLFVEEHFKGKIIYKTLAVKDGKISRILEQREEETGIDDFLIVDVENLSTSDEFIGKDDYGDLDTIISELEARFTQRAKILDKHSDPNMSGPRTAIKKDAHTGETQVDIGGGKYFPRSPGDVEVQYVVWDGQLSAVNQEIIDLMEQLYAVSETCPALFGQLKQGLAESGSALKRLLISPLAKVNRLRKYLDPAMKKILFIASELASKNGLTDAVQFDKSKIAIDWQDGLPNDMTEAIANEATAVSAGLSSKESSIKRLYGFEGDALFQELNKIEEEKIETQPPPPEVEMPTIEEREKILSAK